MFFLLQNAQVWVFHTNTHTHIYIYIYIYIYHTKLVTGYFHFFFNFQFLSLIGLDFLNRSGPIETLTLFFFNTDLIFLILLLFFFYFFIFFHSDFGVYRGRQMHVSAADIGLWNLIIRLVYKGLMLSVSPTFSIQVYSWWH